MILEGLRVGDLENLVLPFLSIDEYESKLGEDRDVIVTAFFVADEEPAMDLNRFIERGTNRVLDAEVSPAPNEDGYYLVFVEIPRDRDFADELLTLIASIEALVDVGEWKFKPYKHKNPVVLNKENLERFVVLDRREAIQRDKGLDETKLREFFRPSALESIDLDGSDLLLRDYQQGHRLGVRAFGPMTETLWRCGLRDAAIRLDERAPECHRLAMALGAGWRVHAVADNLAISRLDSDDLLIVWSD